MNPEAASLIAQLRARFGQAKILTGDDARARAHGSTRMGEPLAIALPESTEDVAAITMACGDAGIPIVAWGGKTGMASGACADGAIAVSLERMNRIEFIDKIDGIMQVEAGCILQTAAEAAEHEDMFLPIDLGARGSATIGGLVSTNAGGLRVLRFGMMRDVVLGLEAVLADGSIISSMRPLLKNNTGYDLRQLFIGAEGTLGIVTRAILRLRPRLTTRNTAFLAVESFDAVATLLRRLEQRLGGQLSTFEVMWREYYDLVTTPPHEVRAVLPPGHAYYLLVEALGGDFEHDRDMFEGALAAAMEDGLIADAVIARSEADAEAMWRVRENGEPIRRRAFVPADVSLRLSRIPQFVEALRAHGEAHWPDCPIILLGHIGDGNIHVVVFMPQEDPALRARISEDVLRLVARFEGSISAEHGIGKDKPGYLHLSRSAEEIALMRRLKQALDPHGMINPGTILPATGKDSQP